MKQNTQTLGRFIVACVFLCGCWSLHSKERTEQVSSERETQMNPRAEESWIHVRYDNGREQWISFPGGRHFIKYEDGQATFADSLLLLSQSYNPRLGRYISEKSPAGISSNLFSAALEEVMWQRRTSNLFSGGLPETAQDYMRMEIEGFEWGGPDIEMHPETINDRLLNRYDAYADDRNGQRVLVYQLWIDPLQQTLVRERLRLEPHQIREQNREYITGEYDFPDSGPSSIYDLGVPLGTEIVRFPDEYASADLRAIISAGKRARDQFPTNTRAVIWQVIGKPDYVSYVYVIHRFGDKLRQDRYVNFDAKYPGYHLPMTTNVHHVMAWLQTQVPDNVGLYDGATTYKKATTDGKPVSENSVYRVTVTKGFLLNTTHHPDWTQWWYTDQKDLEILDAENSIPDCITLRYTRGDIRHEFHVNPTMDYMCVKHVWWRKESGGWAKEREHILSEPRQMSTGSWYFSQKTGITYAEGGVERDQSDWRIHVSTVKEDELPSGLFDANELMLGAEIVRK